MNSVVNFLPTLWSGVRTQASQLTTAVTKTPNASSRIWGRPYAQETCGFEKLASSWNGSVYNKQYEPASNSDLAAVTHEKAISWDPSCLGTSLSPSWPFRWYIPPYRRHKSSSFGWECVGVYIEQNLGLAIGSKEKPQLTAGGWKVVSLPWGGAPIHREQLTAAYSIYVARQVLRSSESLGEEANTWAALKELLTLPSLTQRVLAALWGWTVRVHGGWIVLIHIPLVSKILGDSKA